VRNPRLQLARLSPRGQVKHNEYESDEEQQTDFYGTKRSGAFVARRLLRKRRGDGSLQYTPRSEDSAATSRCREDPLRDTRPSTTTDCTSSRKVRVTQCGGRVLSNARAVQVALILMLRLLTRGWPALRRIDRGAACRLGVRVERRAASCWRLRCCCFLRAKDVDMVAVIGLIDICY
jgi:hypothetical protein